MESVYALSRIEIVKSLMIAWCSGMLVGLVGFVRLLIVGVGNLSSEMTQKMGAAEQQFVFRFLFPR
jgi:hypothetical protein